MVLSRTERGVGLRLHSLRRGSVTTESSASVARSSKHPSSPPGSASSSTGTPANVAYSVAAAGSAQRLSHSAHHPSGSRTFFENARIL